MKRENALLSRRAVLPALETAAALMVLGSFLDFPISQALYNESSLSGIALAAFGEYPAVLGFAAAGAMLIAGHSREKTLTGILQCVGGAGYADGLVHAQYLPDLAQARRRGHRRGVRCRGHGAGVPAGPERRP